MTLRGQTLGLRLNAGGTDPSFIIADNYPQADVFMIQAAGDSSPLTPFGAAAPVYYSMMFELHESSGTTFNSALPLAGM